MNCAQRERRRSDAWFVPGLLACTALALWVVWPAFQPGRIVNLDAPRHLLRSMVMARQFLPSGHVDGWSPWWYLGAQLFLFQSYGYFLLIGIAALALERLVDLETVFKCFYVLPIVALPGALAFLARRLGVSRRGALGAAAAGIVFGSPFGYGVQGVFGIGLLLQGVGVLAFAVAWPFVLETLLDDDPPLWTTVLLLAGVVLLHFISGAYALAISGLAAGSIAAFRRDVRPLARYALMACAVLLLAGHSLFPSLEWRELAGTGVGWGQNKDRLQSFLAGTLFGGRTLALIAVAAAVFCLVRRRDRLAITAAVFLGTALIAGMNAPAWEPGWLRHLLVVLVRPRMLPYAALFQALFFGVAFDGLWLGSEAVARRLGRRRLATAVALALTVTLGIVGCDKLHYHRRWVRTESMLPEKRRDPYQQLVAWLRANVKPPAVISAPRRIFSLRRIGAYSMTSLLNMDTQLYALEGNQAELTRAGRRLRHIDTSAPEQLAKTLRVTGVSLLITTRAGVRRRLTDSPDYELAFDYQRAGPSGAPKSRDRVSVFRVRTSGTRLIVPGIAVADPESSPERLSWNVRIADGHGMRQAVAAVSWHPNWTALVDGREAPITRTYLWTMRFAVAPGAHRVTLEFQRSPRERLYNVLSAVTLGLVAFLWVRELRGRRASGR